MVVLISYDLLRPEQDYQGLIDAIKNLGPWAHVLKSAWAVETTRSPQDLYNFLLKHLDANDQIIIDMVTKNYFGYLNKDVIEWLKARV